MPPPPPLPRAPVIPAVVARRLLLAAQGLLDEPRGPVTAERLYDLIERMGFVQIDSINIVERAHHLTLGSRLQNYRPSLLDRLLERQRRLFEHWTHDASAIPTVWYPFWKERFERYRRRVMERAWWRERLGPDLDRALDPVRERLAREGPLMARDFEDPRGEDAERTWWGWKPQKAALEYLWRTGELVIARRVNFHKVYDLAERVLPELHAAPAPSPAEHLEWAGSTALERLGVATPQEIAAFWAAISIEEARAWCERAAAEGRAVAVEVEAVDGSKPRRAYAVPDWEERAAAAPAAPSRMRFLSPFDPILRDRQRALRLFGFGYRFEAFVPEAQRQYGYYVLPLLEGERLVGRADPKFLRDEGVLEIRRVWWEPGVRESKGRRAALDAAAERLARAIGAESWRFLDSKD
ncbi:MAG TPA: crosslink repair DNA glycosylase YcaQ family protein [Thermoanaerobaculia bacterium]|nr:crosslink repair DNA glycosylase YcaQ family protein [Thermoanaerobaculia bacterium]